MTEKQRTIPSKIWIVVAFIPWIVYGVFARRGLVTAGLVIALGGSIALNVYRLFRKSPKAMEVVTIVFFGLHFTVTVVAGSDLFVRYGGLLVQTALAMMAWGSLALRSPFTYQYARDDWPKEYWKNDVFRRTNEIITTVWALIFTAGIALNGAALIWPGQTIIMTTVLPGSLFAVGFIFSTIFPRLYPKWTVTGRVELQERPFRWHPPAFPFTPPSAADEFDVIIIGAGVGGLTTAALLAKRGLKTLVAEQAHYVGGFCATFQRHGAYRFDMGVHDISGLGPRGPVRRLLKNLGLESSLRFIPMTHEYILGDLRLVVPRDLDAFTGLLGKTFPGEREQVRLFFTEMETIYRELYSDVDSTGGVPRPPLDAETMLRYPLTHPSLFRWMERTYAEMLDSYFTDPLLKRLLSSLSSYLTDRPADLTVLQMAPIFGYYFDGGFYPEGGSGRLSEALAGAIRESGGTILLNTKVTEIIVENGAATAVTLADGRTLRASVIVSNADTAVTLTTLVSPGKLPAPFAEMTGDLTPSHSIFAVFLALDYEPPIAPVTVYRREDGTGLGLALPSRVDPSLAPPGHHVLTLMKSIPHADARSWNRTDRGYKERKAAFADDLIRQAEILLPGLSTHIIARDAATPATVTRYTGHPDGAIYGSTVHNTRLHRQTPIPNLYLTGAGTWPGSGIEAVVISGVVTADTICPEDKKRTSSS